MSDSLQPNTTMYQALAAPASAASAVNPMTMAQGFQNIQRTALENNQMMQQQTARMAIGQAAQQAYDPSTGQVDNKKLVGLISQDPRAAFMAQDVQNAITARELQQQQIDSSKLDMGIKVAENMTGQMGVLANSPNLKRSDVFNLMNNYIAMSPHNDMARSVAMNFLSTMPPDDSPASTEALRGRLNSGMLGFKNTADVLKMAHPDWQANNTGNGITFTNNSGIGSATGGSGPQNLRMGLTPDAAFTPAGTVVGGDQRVHTVLKGQLAGAEGVPGGIGAGGMADGQGGAPAGQMGAGGPTPPGAIAAPQAPSAGPANAMGVNGAQAKPMWNPQPSAEAGGQSPAQAMLSGSGAAALTPAQEETQKVVAQTFQNNRSELDAKLDAQNQVTQAMANEEKLLDLARTGPGGGNAVRFGQALQAVGRTTGIPGLEKWGKNLTENPDNPDAYEKATSAAQSFASTQFQNLTNQFKGAFKDGGTQAEFENLMQSYISQSTNKDARAQIFNVARQRQDQLLAEQAAAGSYAKAHQNDATGPNWSNFQTEWQPHLQKYGLSSSALDPKGVIAPIGDTKGLLQSVGMHPESSDPDLVPTGHPSWVPPGAVYNEKYGAYYQHVPGTTKLRRVAPPGGQ